MKEVWKPVLGYEDEYEVSNRGTVRNARTLHVLAPTTRGHGYLYVNLWRENRQTIRTVHSIVTEAFHGPRPPRAVIRHLDGSRTNNTPGNLRWGTQSENISDRWRHERIRADLELFARD